MAGVISGSSNEGKNVKNECNDPKINAMALKKEYYQKTASAAAKQVRTSSASVSQKNNEENLPKDSEDIESIKSIFSWKKIAGYNIPFIIRVISGEKLKFVSVRMAETQLLSNYLHHLHADIYKYTSVRSYFITDSEAKLLNEINIGHSDGIFGKDTFYAGKDYIVRLEDVLEFYTFIKVCYNKLLSNITPGCIEEKCGFIRINSESVIPYCFKDGRKYLPLFYFEGEIERLRQRAVKLKDWNLAYLKFCCKVQGIKNELYTFDSYTAITLDDIQNYFPPNTHFEEYWPAQVVNTNLLINQMYTHVHPSGVWIRAPSEVPENIIPHPLTASTPVIPQSMPVVENTFQNRWPPNQLGPQISQGNSLMNGGSHVTSLPPLNRTNNTTPAISNTVSYSNTVPISQDMYNSVPSSSVMSHSNQIQQFYNHSFSNNSQAQQQQVQQQPQQKQQQKQPQPQQEQNTKVQPYGGQTSVHGHSTNTQQHNAVRNVAPIIITLGTEIIDLSSPPSSPAPTPVQYAPHRPNVEWKLKKVPERKREHDSKNDAAYKGPQISQGNSLMNGGSHVTSLPPLNRTNNTTPAISNTVSYSNTVPISQDMYNSVPSSSVMSHSNQIQQFYNHSFSNNSQAQQQQVQQQPQQKQQQKQPQPQQEQNTKVQPYGGQTSVHGHSTNTQQHNAVRNVAPIIITLGTEIIDLSSPPSSPAPTPVQYAPRRPYLEWKLKKIPEWKLGQDIKNDAPYKVQRTTIERRMIYCINAKPYIYTDLMVTLEDVIQAQLLSCTVSRCAYVLYKYFNITLFCGNSEQMNVLRENGRLMSNYPNETPLVMVQDITYALPQLITLLSEQNQQYQSAPGSSKRHRTS